MIMKNIMIDNWKDFIADQRKQEYYISLTEKIKVDAEKYIICPSRKDLFSAFNLCPLNKTKVIILGQDPYHSPNCAHGLAFSVRENIHPIPPSLKNIYKELQSDLGIEPAEHGCLIDWTKQGILLLNTTLTVRQGEANSHKDYGWTIFTDNAISLLNKQEKPLVFILWGSFAQKKKDLITNERHLILSSPHPSPFSATNGFFGSKPFSKTNKFLEDNNIEPINWNIK
jgi:uracil-DNA glycosylase